MNAEINPVDLSNVVIARKLSVLEYEARELGLTQLETLSHYKETGADWETLLSSHDRQQQSLSNLRESLPGVEVVTGFQITRDLVKDMQAVIALGGDDHYQYVSHFLDRQFLIPINSDTKKSKGALSDFTVPSFIEFLSQLRSGNFLTENWTRLQVTYNGQPIREQAVSQVYVGAADTEEMSRYIVEYRGVKEAQKTSGMLVATGTGSGQGSWYDAANRYFYPNGNRFSRILPKAAFIPREPNDGSLSAYLLKAGEIESGEKITLTSLMNKQGRVGIDALVRRDFPRGTTVAVEISESPLKVVRKGFL